MVCWQQRPLRRRADDGVISLGTSAASYPETSAQIGTCTCWVGELHGGRMALASGVLGSSHAGVLPGGLMRARVRGAGGGEGGAGARARGLRGQGAAAGRGGAGAARGARRGAPHALRARRRERRARRAGARRPSCWRAPGVHSVRASRCLTLYACGTGIPCWRSGCVCTTRRALCIVSMLCKGVHCSARRRTVSAIRVAHATRLRIARLDSSFRHLRCQHFALQAPVSAMPHSQRGL